MRSAKQHLSGFTLIEVLVAIVIFAIIAVVSSTFIISLLNANRGNNNRVVGNTDSQRAIEYIVSEWRDNLKYDNACVTNSTFPTGVTVTTQGLRDVLDGTTTSSSGSVTGPSLTPQGDRVPLARCGPTLAVNNSAPVMRRIVVNYDNNGTQSQIILDVNDPQPWSTP